MRAICLRQAGATRGLVRQANDAAGAGSRRLRAAPPSPARSRRLYQRPVHDQDCDQARADEGSAPGRLIGNQRVQSAYPPPPSIRQGRHPPGTPKIARRPGYLAPIRPHDFPAVREPHNFG